MVFRSNSYKSTSFNEMTFEDKTSGENMFFHAQKDHTTKIENNQKHSSFAIEAGYRLKRRVNTIAKLRTQGWLSPSMSGRVALERIDKAIADGKTIDITEDEDVERLCAMAFLPDRYREKHPCFRHDFAWAGQYRKCARRATGFHLFADRRRCARK